MQTLIELLQPAGPALARRWLTALLRIERSKRLGIVEEIERRVGIATGESRDGDLDVVHPPVQRDGYVEQMTTTYSARGSARSGPRARRSPIRKPG